MEVHHIQPRADTVMKRNKDGTHQNDLRNLIVVCSKCHDNIHDTTISVGSVVQTSQGPKRSITVKTRTSATSATSDKTEEIEEYLRKYPDVMPKRAIFDLEQKGINITLQSLRTFRKNL